MTAFDEDNNPFGRISSYSIRVVNLSSIADFVNNLFSMESSTDKIDVGAETEVLTEE